VERSATLGTVAIHFFRNKVRGEAALKPRAFDLTFTRNANGREENEGSTGAHRLSAILRKRRD
jgi:hypothetical protein